jgi:ABC-2 type transport system permease protein
MRRILVLAWVEVLHVVRDRATLFQALFIPIVQLLILANAATFQVRNTRLYVVDLDHSETSRQLISHFVGSGRFQIVGASESRTRADNAILGGQASLVVAIPKGFERSVMRDGHGAVQLVVDGASGATAGVAEVYASRIVTAFANELTRTYNASQLAGQSMEVKPHPGAVHIDVRPRNWYNASLNYQYYMVPGILVALVTIIGTLLTAQNIAREKELGTIEQLNVTPITRGQFIAAKLLPFWVLALIELVLGLIVGRLVFGVPIVGSPLLLLGVAAIYLVVALGIGLWISTIVDTQQQAMFVTFFVIVLYLLMSGLFTPVDSMPRWAQIVADFNPVRHFVFISRAILLKGAGLREIVRPLVILVIYAIGILTLAVRQYAKRSQ